MDPRQPLAVDAPQALAVHGDGLLTCRQVQLRPPSQRRLEGGQVEPDEDPVEGGLVGVRHKIVMRQEVVVEGLGGGEKKRYPLGDGRANARTPLEGTDGQNEAVR